MKPKKNNPIANVYSFAKNERGRLYFAALLAGISGIFLVVPYFVISEVLFMLMSGDQEIKKYLMLGLIAGGTYLLKEVFAGLSTAISHDAAFRILRNIRCELVNKMGRLPLGFIYSKPSGAFKQTIIDSVENLEHFLAHIFPESVPNLMAPVVIIIYLFRMNWILALSSIACILVGGIIMGIMYGSRAMEIYRTYTEGNTRMQETAVEYVNGMEVIKAFNQTAPPMKQFEKAVVGVKNYMLKWYRHCWPYLSATYAIITSTIIFVLPTAGILYYKGSIDMKILIYSIVLSLGTAGPLWQAFSFVEHLNILIPSDKQIQEILQEEELNESTTKAPIKDYGIEFSHVCFGYGDTEILHDISFTAETGSMTGLVGPSGSGKSTISKLLVRFWDTKSGVIKIGGCDIKEISFDQMSDVIAYVAQDNFLLNDTILENVRLGRPDATTEEIIEALKKAECEDFIGRFPDKYNTNVGDAGDKLSGGERQRIAIARAIIKNAPIIVLDEATASIDPENEYKIQQALNELTKNKTLIVIAHRLSTITEADNIIVVKDGLIHDQGTHEDLLENSQLYTSMWEAHIGAKNWNMGQEDETYV